MLNFDENALLEKHRGALAIIGDVEKAVDAAYKHGFKNVFFIGVGGATTSHMEWESILKSHSKLDFWMERASEFITSGNSRLSKDSLVFLSSFSGDTPETIEVAECVRKKGAKIIAFMGKDECPLSKLVDYPIVNIYGMFSFWLVVVFRLMYLRGEFPDYDEFFIELKELPEALVDVQRAADAKSEEFARKYCNEPIHYFIGSGNMWGWTVCYSMCVLEECFWIRAKSVHASDFFHGTLEVIDRDTSVVLFMGEDATRPLTERVKNFVPRISSKFTIFDTKDYKLQGISLKYRAYLSPLVMDAVCERITMHLEDLLKHPRQIRRYYRKLDY